jgi:hypothetical protein
MHLFDDDSSALARAATRETEAPSRPHADGITTNAPGAAPVPTPANLLRLQRRVGNNGVVQMMRDDDPHGLKGLLGKGGSPLDVDTRIQMESAIGADFSSVRIHTGGEADRSAKSLGAHAYTAGEDIVFASGRYDPASPAGQHTLAHELTHVVQQRSGPVDGSVTNTGVKVSDPSDHFERAAEANADRVTSLQTKAPTEPAAPAAPAPAVQREDDEIQTKADPASAIQREGEEEEVQTLSDPTASIQREGEEEEVQTLSDPTASIQREGEEEEVQTKADPAAAIQREGAEEEEVG